MANCTNCGTWNPDDKTRCWRCSEELPKPVPKKAAPRRIAGLPVWTWVLLAAMVIFWLATTVFSMNGGFR